LQLSQYKANRALLSFSKAERTRELCTRCMQPRLTCLCSVIRPFDCNIKFVILQHTREAQKRISTGRFSHLCLKDSEHFRGFQFNGKEINELLENKNFHSVILFPEIDSLNISQVEPTKLNDYFSPDKKLCIFVLDGTWTTAKKILSHSPKLQALPKICFQAPTPSRFRVRQQPNVNFYSTAEAIHQCIEILGTSRGFAVPSRLHDNLLQTFEHLVNYQIELANQPKRWCQWNAPVKSLSTAQR
jgi:DTW domain-containing protein